MAKNGYAEITHVAIQYKGEVYSLPSPNRHHHVIQHIASIHPDGGVNGTNVQGFLDENGNFLNRRGAFIRAQKTDQINRRTGAGF